MPEDEFLLDLDYVSSCSTTDCTGLIPSLPQSEAERESYDEVYQYLPQAVTKEKEETNSNKYI